MNQFLLVLCGLPASGKTTLAIELKNQAAPEIEIEIVSTDKWRDDAYYADFRPENEKNVRERALRKTEVLLATGKNVVHDDTNYYASMRHELYDIARMKRCVFAVVHVETPLQTALDWNLTRKPVIPEHVITGISERLDTPGSKYRWDRPIASVNLSKDEVWMVAGQILEIIPELKPLSLDKPYTGETIEDLRDRVTRQVVSRFLWENPFHRTDPEVHRLRKSVLREAKDEGLTARETEERLSRQLARLTRRVS
ncbi:MAG: AAA family ATPase [Candidatus Thorarchaeota archaeon]